MKAKANGRNPLITCPLPAAVLIVCCVGFALIPRAALSSKDERVIQARADLEILRKVASSVTNLEERANWDKRVELAEQSLAHVERLVDLEKEEQDFLSGRRSGVEERLNAVLATIETDTAAAETAIAAANDSIRDLKLQRVDIESRIAESGHDLGPDAKAELDGRLKNIDAAILALITARDGDQLRVRLAKEAKRIDLMRRTVDLTSRITIQSLLRKKEAIALARHNMEEFALLRDRLTAHREEMSIAVNLARQKHAQLDREIQLISDQLKVEKRGGTIIPSVVERLWRNDSPEVHRLREMAAKARSEKTVLKERIQHLAEQKNALSRQIGIVDQGMTLFSGEADFTRYQLATATHRYLRRTATPFAVVLILIIAYVAVSRKVFPRIYKEESLFVARRLGGYGLALLVVLILSASFIEDLKAIATVMGIVGAAIVIALQDLCSSFAGWFVITTSGKVKVGDRVEIAGHRGDVIDIQLLRTVMLELNNWLDVDEPTGRTIIAPNNFVFKEHVFNYSHVHPYIWGKIDVTVTFETDAAAAAELLLRLTAEETEQEFREADAAGSLMEKRYGKKDGDYRPRIHTVIADSGVTFSLFYVTHYKRFAATRDRVSARIVQEFARRNDMDFAYPTARRIHTPPEMPRANIG